MLLNGEPLTTATLQPWVLPRPQGQDLTFLLAPLPLGFHQRLKECGILPPAAPLKLARDSQGKPLRDAAGNVVQLPQSQSPEHMCRMERYHQRVAVLAISEALRSDPQVEFETQPPTSQLAVDWETFADARFDELERAGFTPGDVVRLCREICRLSNLLDVDIKAAQGRFSSPGACPTE